MRTSRLAAFLFVALLACGFLSASSAIALISAPAGLAGALDQAKPLRQAEYVCRHVRRCGPYGCRWRRVCFWTGPRRGYQPCAPGFTVQDGVCKPYRGY